VVSVASGGAMSAVKVRLTSGQEVTAAITAESARDLGLATGTAVQALVKSTEVAVATGEVEGVSTRNRMAGVVTGVDHGAVMSTVKISLPSGEEHSAQWHTGPPARDRPAPRRREAHVDARTPATGSGSESIGSPPAVR
jgi:molybdopterin-binding protein